MRTFRMYYLAFFSTKGCCEIIIIATITHETHVYGRSTPENGLFEDGAANRETFLGGENGRFSSLVETSRENLNDHQRAMPTPFIWLALGLIANVRAPVLTPVVSIKLVLLRKLLSYRKRVYTRVQMLKGVTHS